MRVLNPPREVTEDASRQEVLRALLDKGMLSLSLSHKFPKGYKHPLEVWPMLISDIFHHVVDAIVSETGHDRKFVQNQLHLAFEEVLRSERGSRTGKLKKFDTRLPELPDPDLSGEKDCVEIVRIVLLKGSINVMVRVGMWLPDDEESVWGNLLYDLTYMISSSIDANRTDEVRAEIAQKIIEYIAKPSTKYSGEYYDHA